MSNKKRILVVDDTPANIEAAKAYFSHEPDHEYVYATDRKTAEELLPTVDALITDREMPYQQDEMKENYKLEDMDEYKLALQTNGYILMAKALEKNIPAIMITSHRDTFILGVEDVELAKEIAKSVSGLDPYSNECYEAGFKMNQNLEMLKQSTKGKGDMQAWEVAFIEFLPKLKFNEKPAEIKSFPMK